MDRFVAVYPEETAEDIASPKDGPLGKSLNDATPEFDRELREVIRREVMLHRPDVRADGELVLSLLHRDFREFGSSGRMWDAAAEAEALAANPWIANIEVCDLNAVRLGPDAVLLTYMARTERSSLRSSVWVRDQEEWRLFFHQGTTKSDADGC
jgi:hypothetical protein